MHAIPGLLFPQKISHLKIPRNLASPSLRTPCFSPNRPRPPRPTRTSAARGPSCTSSTRPRGRPPWSRRCATCQSATTSRPRPGQTPPTRSPAHCRPRRAAGTSCPLPGHPSPPPDPRRPTPSAPPQTLTTCPARPQRPTETTVCQQVPGIKLYAATLSELSTVRGYAKVCISRIFIYLGNLHRSVIRPILTEKTYDSDILIPSIIFERFRKTKKGRKKKSTNGSSCFNSTFHKLPGSG